MKKLLYAGLIITFYLIPLTCINAQQPIVAPHELPNMRRFLPPPPDTASAAFRYDQAQYRWGKAQREDSARCALARQDAEWSVDYMCRIMGGAMGMTLSKEATPAIYEMLTAGILSADRVSETAKSYYMRIRPYMYYGEPTIAPWDEEELSHNGSYPSGHTILGWTTALLLTEVAPEYADTILARGYMYGQSRVIAGFHWQSDVDAGRLASSAAVARLHSEKRFLKMMKKARKEYLRLSQSSKQSR